MTAAENTAIVQDMYAAFGRGDIDALLAGCADDIVWQGVYGTGPQVPFSGERRGKAAVAEFFKLVGENEQFSNFEPQQFVATGDTVVALGHYTATTPVGKQFDGDWAMVFHLRDGKVVEFKEFCDSAGINEAHTARTAAAGA
jgi:ketosteroid isomerase-like protein